MDILFHRAAPIVLGIKRDWFSLGTGTGSDRSDHCRAIAFVVWAPYLRPRPQLRTEMLF